MFEDRLENRFDFRDGGWFDGRFVSRSRLVGRSVAVKEELRFAKALTGAEGFDLKGDIAVSGAIRR